MTRTCGLAVMQPTFPTPGLQVSPATGEPAQEAVTALTSGYGVILARCGVTPAGIPGERGRV